jgi:EKC/KEOPS complex subunit CGI121/TPRKB
VVKVSVTSDISHDSVAAHLEASIKGTPVPFDDETLSQISDIAKIKKFYKLGALPDPKANSGQANGTYTDDAKRRLELSLLGAIALRGS